MKKSNLSLLIIALVVLLLSNCDKQHARKLSGTYDCKVEYHYWDMTPTSIDSIYNESIKIEQDGKFVEVFGKSIHIDSLWEEKEYKEGNGNNYFSIVFKNDSLIMKHSSGGLGGNATSIHKGVKK